MFLQKPLEMQSGETSVKYELSECCVILLRTFCETVDCIVCHKKQKQSCD